MVVHRSPQDKQTPCTPGYGVSISLERVISLNIVAAMETNYLDKAITKVARLIQIKSVVFMYRMIHHSMQ